MSSVIFGIDAHLVEVEVDIVHGLPSFTTVGLPEIAVKESRERVKSAVKNSGFAFPDDRITVNLAPANLRKSGTGLDLPIAMGILGANGIIPPSALDQVLILGELSLDGRIKPVLGSLSMAIAAKNAGIKKVVIPIDNCREAAVIREIDVFGVDHLSQAVSFLCGDSALEPAKPGAFQRMMDACPPEEDFSDIRGQEHVKRAMEIAAAGGHNMLMVGPPGAGKTMLARRISGILPRMHLAEAIETTRIHSVAGLLAPAQSLVLRRPLRTPHHTISEAGLVGGGSTPRPGEVSLANHGVLFLDELPEYRRNVLEVLRQPLEDRTVSISRAAGRVVFPANIMLVAAMNPCPCGYASQVGNACHCSISQVRRYLARISAPLLDRIDIYVDVPAVSYTDLSGLPSAESSSCIRQRVVAARERQHSRLQRYDIYCNAQMSSRHLSNHCALSAASSRLMENAAQQFGMSARGYFRTLKIARTIADLSQQSMVGPGHIAEAIQYRSQERLQFR